MIERVLILKRTEVFRALPEPVLASLARYLEEVNLEAGQEIFRKGDVGKAMYIVVDGTVRIHDGEKTRALMGPNEVFGERTALTAEFHRASATAAEDCQLLRLDQDLLYEAMAGNAAIAKGIIKVLLERFQ
ncbi:MAG: cyclic nucleotide-binding domain-containing protein [Gemmatimonadales bacterium]